MTAGREEVGSGEDYRRGNGQKVGAKERKHVTSDGDEVGVLLDLEEDELPSLLETEHSIGDAICDEASVVVEVGTPGTTGDDWLAWEASREVDDRFGGDWAGKVGVGEGGGSWVMRSVHPLLDVRLLAERTATREPRCANAAESLPTPAKYSTEAE